MGIVKSSKRKILYLDLTIPTTEDVKYYATVKFVLEIKMTFNINLNVLLLTRFLY